MVASHHFTRIDTQELKDVIFQKIGSQRAENYFHQLQRFLGYEVSKTDFDNSCLQTLGRENIRLHNRLLCAIIHNSCQPRIPSHKSRKAEGLGIKTVNGYQRSCFQSLYGDGLPSSPRKSRTPINRERKLCDRPSPLGPFGKSPSLTCEETVSRIQEQNAAELHSSCSKPPKGEDGEEVEQFMEIPSTQRSITPPYGLSWKHKPHPHVVFTETCQISGVLPDNVSLLSRMEKKLELEGVSISLEAANALNKGLNLYMKRLLEPTVNGSHHSLMTPRNDQMISQSNGLLLPGIHINMLDFQVAIETNPCVLGDNWPTHLEKISQSLDSVT